MDNKHYMMLGEALRTRRNSELSDLEFGKVVVQYVELLEREAERDARDSANGKGE